MSLAFHPQRGVREMKHLKPGWRWLTDDETEAHEMDGTTPEVTRLAKPGLMNRGLNLDGSASAWRKWRRG
jgi:hypothetical protein